jgi:hypothetical protein
VGGLGGSDLFAKLVLLWLKNPPLLNLLKLGLFRGLMPYSVIFLPLRSARLLIYFFFGYSALTGSLLLLIYFSMVNFRLLDRLASLSAFSSSGLF